MHDPELNDDIERRRHDQAWPAGWTERRQRPRRKRTRVAVQMFEELFLLLLSLRAANADSLIALFFEKRGIAKRTAMRRLSWLVREGYLGHERLFDSTRALYFVTSKAERAFPSVRQRATATLKKLPPPRQAAFCWLRATMFAALVRDGYTIGRSAVEQQHLRRQLVDADVARLERLKAKATPDVDRELARAEANLRKLRRSSVLTPLFRSHCERCGWTGALNKPVAACAECNGRVEARRCEQQFRCGQCGFTSDTAVQRHVGRRHEECMGTMHQTEPLRFDVAWRFIESELDVLIVFVDDPSRSLEAQLSELPLELPTAALVRVLLRSADLDSIYDASSKKWVALGARHAALVRELVHGDRAERIEIVNYRRELQFHVLH